ncbi:MAG: Calx-beta domain-containing protein [Acidimicrobiales bacterium]
MKRFSALTAAASLSLAGLIVVGAAAGPAHGLGVGGICTPTPTPTVSIGDDNVYEHQLAQVQVSLNWASCGTIKVDYNTSNGTAKSGSDYVAKSGTLTFSPGQTSKLVSVTLIDDDDHEPNENFYVMLKNHANVLPGDPTGKITIYGLEPAG